MSKAQWVGHCKATGKRMYRSEREAERALAQARSQRLRSRHRRKGTVADVKVEYDYFHCDCCDNYHLTSGDGRRIYERMS